MRYEPGFARGGRAGGRADGRNAAAAVSATRLAVSGAAATSAAVTNSWRGRAAVGPVFAAQLLNSVDTLSTYVGSLQREVDKLRQELALARRPAAKNRHKVALFTILFGEDTVKEPWLPIFIKSAGVSGVDYFIVGDPPIPNIKLPPNVKHIRVSYMALVDKISEELFGGRTLWMRDANLYKVIDVKPLLGYLFRDLLQPYGFWGHVDNDVIMGNVHRFLTHDLLDNFDIISGLRKGDNGRDELNTWGPFTVYRNVPKITELFRRSHDLFHVFNNHSAFFFDEWGGADRKYYEGSMTQTLNEQAGPLGIRWHGGFPLGWDGECESRADAARCSECILTSRYYSEGMTRSTLTWNRTVFAADEEYTVYEVLMCHFQSGKKLMHDQFAKMDVAMRDNLLVANPLYMSYKEGFHA